MRTQNGSFLSPAFLKSTDQSYHFIFHFWSGSLELSLRTLSSVFSTQASNSHISGVKRSWWGHYQDEIIKPFWTELTSRKKKQESRYSAVSVGRMWSELSWNQTKENCVLASLIKSYYWGCYFPSLVQN